MLALFFVFLAKTETAKTESKTETAQTEKRSNIDRGEGVKIIIQMSVRISWYFL